MSSGTPSNCKAGSIASLFLRVSIVPPSAVSLALRQKCLFKAGMQWLSLEKCSRSQRPSCNCDWNQTSRTASAKQVGLQPCRTTRLNGTSTRLFVPQRRQHLVCKSNLCILPSSVVFQPMLFHVFATSCKLPSDLLSKFPPSLLLVHVGRWLKWLRAFGGGVVCWRLGCTLSLWQGQGVSTWR